MRKKTVEVDIYANSTSTASVDDPLNHDGPPIFKVQSLSRDQLHTSSYQLEVMPTRIQPQNEPLFELLIDGHHLDILILLHVVPRGGIGLGPDDYRD
jgi:hypothetical protein